MGTRTKPRKPKSMTAPEVKAMLHRILEPEYGLEDNVIAEVESLIGRPLPCIGARIEWNALYGLIDKEFATHA